MRLRPVRPGRHAELSGAPALAGADATAAEDAPAAAEAGEILDLHDAATDGRPLGPPLDTAAVRIALAAPLAALAGLAIAHVEHRGASRASGASRG